MFMENSTSNNHGSGDMNGNSPKVPPVPDLSLQLTNLNLNPSTINNSIVASSSLSRNPQFQYQDTLFGLGLSDTTARFPSGMSQILSGNNFATGFVNGGCLFPGTNVQELEDLESIPETSIIMKAMNDAGSRELQEILKMRKPEFTEPIFEKVMAKSEVGIPYILYLMINQNGWYVVSKLIDACNWQQLVTIVTQITSNNFMFIDVSLTKYGSCSVLKLIKVLKKSSLVSHLVSNLAVQFYRVMTEKYGLYIISECLDQLDDTQNELLYRSAIVFCLKLATHKQGCISLNAFIEKIRGPLRETLINWICENAVFLAFDPSGNYVVQKVLAIENPEFTHKIAMKLKGRYASLSRQKAGSHLVEKCLNSTGMMTVVEDLIQSKQVMSLAEDKYGNYVIQTALRETKRTAKINRIYSNLVGCILPYIAKLQHGYGRNVYNWIIEELPLLADQPSSSMLSGKVI